MSLTPERRARLQRVLADELTAAAHASAADHDEFVAEIERRLSTVTQPQPGGAPEPEPVQSETNAGPWSSGGPPVDSHGPGP